MRRLLATIAIFFFCATTSIAALHFPALTGRVVDNAHLLSAQTQQSLEAQLAEYETSSSNQLVVVTIPSLQGQTIEEYGYQLGRAWGIGQKGKDNGVLLIVAPTEHKVRIEVGYGLEGMLTDTASGQIIHSIITPAFKQGQMERGIVTGVQAIETVLSGQALTMPNAETQTHSSQNSSSGMWIVWLILLVLFSQVVLFCFYVVGIMVGTFLSLFGFRAFSRWLERRKMSILPADKSFLLWLLMPSGRITGSGGGSFGGGFSGGGGSFGGGGSSGSW